MTNFIPIFPLGIVVFPGETLNLHIFEERYKQLVTDCFAEAKPFGIPTVLINGVAEIGTLVEIIEVVKVYENGKMDIKTKGLQVFKILETVKEIPNKLFSGAIVTYPNNQQLVATTIMQKIMLLVRELHKVLKVEKKFKKPDAELMSYDIAHHIGLSLNEEYELLSLLKETQRLEYLKRHLKKVIGIVQQMESLKDRIQLNGHFRELKGFNFDV